MHFRHIPAKIQTKNLNVVYYQFLAVRGNISIGRSTPPSSYAFSYYSMGVGIGAGGLWPLWIFKHGTNIVDRDLRVLFFGPFFRCPPSP